MKILFCEHNHDIETPVKLLQAGFKIDIVKEEIEGVHEFDRESLLATLKQGQYDVLVCGFKFQIDKEVLDSAPIKAVFTRTTGLDHIDYEYCKDKKIEVVNLKGEELMEIVAVPELILQKTLELLRRDKRELKNKKVGIIGGQGRIAKIAKRYFEALGAFVNTQDRLDKDGSNVIQAGKLEVVLETSDIILLSISSIEENRNFFDREKFELMKDGAYFLNSSRRWLVDNEALTWALDNKLAGAWSDFPVGFTHENLLVTNHQGGQTIESSIKTEQILVQKIINYAKSFNCC